MKALVFAAGLGTRLKPFTLSHPKALVPVGGVPMLERVILKLIACGADEIVVNVHHFAQQIIDFLEDHDHFGVTMHVSDESDHLLDTGGGILKARKWLDAPEGREDHFIVHNADILTDFDLAAMYEAHVHTRPLATLLVAERETSRYLLIDNDALMRGWANTRTGEILPSSLNPLTVHPMAFGGVHILSTAVFPLLESFSHESSFPIMPFYIQACQSHAIKAYQPSCAYHWVDVGKPETLASANALFE